MVNDTDELLGRIRAALAESEEMALQVVVDGLFPDQDPDERDHPQAAQPVESSMPALRDTLTHGEGVGLEPLVPPRAEDTIVWSIWPWRRRRQQREINEARAGRPG